MNLTNQIRKIQLFILFLYITKLATYGLLSIVIGMAHGWFIGVIAFIFIYLLAGYLERQIYAHKRAINMLIMLEGLKDLNKNLEDDDKIE